MVVVAAVKRVIRAERDVDKLTLIKQIDKKKVTFNYYYYEMRKYLRNLKVSSVAIQ